MELLFFKRERDQFHQNLKGSGVLKKLSDYAKLQISLTTGSNQFFCVNQSVVDKYELDKYAQPLLHKISNAPGVEFSSSDWKGQSDDGYISYLLIFPTLDQINPETGAGRYLALGEQSKVHLNYKCAVRKEWQIVPRIELSDVIFSRHSHHYPKLVNNQAQAHITDRYHRVSIKKGINKKALIASFYNSLSFASSEICGRNYGGGALEILPAEASNILMPYHSDNERLFEQVDQMFRSGTDINEILKMTDKIILKEHYGFSDEEVALAHNIWVKMRDRRVKRG